jgi:hypothetical protein
MSLIERIQTVRQRLREKTLVNEASVSIGVVLPILDALGWPAFDPSVVAPEYNVGTRRVDFALLTHGRPAVFVEVKQPGLAGQADRQLFEYAFHEGVPIAILTDGATWHVYLPAMQGSYDDRRVYLLDLLERDPEESAARLQRYLSRDAVESGEAFERAQTDYKRSRQRKGAEAAIPQAWANLVSEPRLADLLAAEVESVCGFQPEASDLATFLSSLRPTAGALPVPSDRSKVPDVAVREPSRQPASPPPRREVPWAAGSWTGKGVTLPAGTELRGQHHGNERMARVEGGKIVYAGRGYTSPSAAGNAATGRSTNGWIFWEVKRPGDAGWLLLTVLRD